MDQLDGRVALVTGAASGIGREIALTLAGAGADIALLDIGSSGDSESGLESIRTTAEALGARCIAAVGDVRVQDDLDGLVDAAIRQFGRIDIACANAGIMRHGSYWEMSDGDWQQMADINIGGVWRTAKAVREQMCAQRSGCIIATASVAGVEAEDGSALYGATKAAVLSLVRSFALELGPYGVRANAVLPGAVRTSMGDNPELRAATLGEAEVSDADYDAEMAKWSALRGVTMLPPQAIADAVLWLASDGARYVTGVELPVDAGHMILPGHNAKPVLDNSHEG